MDSLGLVSVDVLRAALAADSSSAAVVSVMWANNEVGAVQPVASLAAAAHEYGVPFHTDAVQAAAQLPVDFAASGADAMTVTAHKLGGPVGVGALILGKSLSPGPCAARRRPGARHQVGHARRPGDQGLRGGGRGQRGAALA